MNRLTPLRIWGPSGPEDYLGTSYAMQKMQEMFGRDIYTRGGVIDARGMALDIVEFDYKGVTR